jgi:hypothetical protein
VSKRKPTQSEIIHQDNPQLGRRILSAIIETVSPIKDRAMNKSNSFVNIHATIKPILSRIAGGTSAKQPSQGAGKAAQGS